MFENITTNPEWLAEYIPFLAGAGTGILIYYGCRLFWIIGELLFDWLKHR